MEINRWGWVYLITTIVLSFWLGWLVEYYRIGLPFVFKTQAFKEHMAIRLQTDNGIMDCYMEKK